MANSNSFLSNRKFYGDHYFPRGLSRCGEFTISQVALLERHGCCYEGIDKGTIQPKNQEEKNFLAVCHGTREPETEHEKVWALFKKKTQTKQKISAFGQVRSQPITPLPESFDDDLDDDIIDSATP